MCYFTSFECIHVSRYLRGGKMLLNHQIGVYYVKSIVYRGTFWGVQVVIE